MGTSDIYSIYDDPHFTVDGATANDVRQGETGDCWFLAAVTALSGTEEKGQDLRLLSKLFVAKNEKVGVYGFVFFRGQCKCHSNSRPRY